MSAATSRKIFVNLPVRNLDTSVEFFTNLGFTFDPRFTDESGTCMVVSDEAFVMLLVQLYRAPGNLTVSDLDPGAWLGLAGSVVALIGGFFGARTTTVVTTTPGPTAVVP